VVTTSIKLKRFFFDRPEVRARLGERKAKALGYFGGDVQRKSRALIGKRAKRSKPRPPGKPPKSHVDDGSSHANLRKILFHLDPRGDAVIIGPVGINGKYSRGISVGTVPALHEFGGTAIIREKRVGTLWRSLGQRRPYPGQPTRTRKATYAKRPFMNPGFESIVERNRRRGKMPGLSVGPGVSATIGPA
jgi:hypothetical protein